MPFACKTKPFFVYLFSEQLSYPAASDKWIWHWRWMEIYNWNKRGNVVGAKEKRNSDAYTFYLTSLWKGNFSWCSVSKITKNIGIVVTDRLSLHIQMPIIMSEYQICIIAWRSCRVPNIPHSIHTHFAFGSWASSEIAAKSDGISQIQLSKMEV